MPSEVLAEISTTSTCGPKVGLPVVKVPRFGRLASPQVFSFVAVAFATILAVVAGLTLSGASAVSHDLYASVWRHGNVDSATVLRWSKGIVDTRNALVGKRSAKIVRL